MEGIEKNRNSEDLKNLSIVKRKQIEYPENWVSVYHETKEKYLQQIDKMGLREDVEKNIGEHNEMQRRNKLIDEFRPEYLKKAGVSRNNIFAYPFLEEGHGLFGADLRYTKRKHDRQILGWDYDTFEKFNPAYLEKLGVVSKDDFIYKLTSKEWLRENYPGEVLEIKVDPVKCYVGDLEYITRIQDDIGRGWDVDDVLKDQAENYWHNVVRLDLFLKWYKKPEYNENDELTTEVFMFPEMVDEYKYHLLKGALDNLPQYFYNPEIMITENVQSKYIKVLE